MSPKPYRNLRIWCAVLAALGLLILIAGMAMMLSVGRGPQARPPANVALFGMALAVASALTALLSSRCPACHRWVHPWYYPRRGAFCPRCGKAGEE